MKVNLAAHVISNSVYAALKFLDAKGEANESALATATFVKQFNDIFDVLKSTFTRDPVPLRRPLQVNSQGHQFLKDSLEWLERFKLLNPKASTQLQCVKGWQQSINVILLLLDILQNYGVKFLRTRQICQDSLELFIGKIRLAKSEVSNMFRVCSLVCQNSHSITDPCTCYWQL